MSVNVGDLFGWTIVAPSSSGIDWSYQEGQSRAWNQVKANQLQHISAMPLNAIRDKGCTYCGTLSDRTKGKCDNCGAPVFVEKTLRRDR